MMSPIRAVIFDLDGVLVSTDQLHYRAWKRLADEEGIPFSEADNERLRGVGRMESLEILLERATHPYSDEDRKRMADRKNEFYRSLLESITPADALPGVRPLLRALRARDVRLAVASGSRNARTILDKLELASAFDTVVTGDDITHAKPDPELFRLAAERLGILPSECLVVEDAAAGVEAARLASMPVLAIGPQERFSNGTRRIGSLAETTPDDLLHDAHPRPPRTNG